MLIKQGSAGGGSVDITDAPKITFDGKWLPWRIEFYAGKAYWEAWLFSSGTLTVEGSYTADAWGIGGGGAAYWSGGSSWNRPGTHGCANQAENIPLSGNVAVTIGAGASSDGSGDPPFPGGTTSLGNALTCVGANRGGSTSVPRYRFGDADKSGECLGGGRDGWLPLNINCQNGDGTGDMGMGAGAGAGVDGYAWAGALVIRIPM